MKTLSLIPLLAITVICTGQNPVGNSLPQNRLHVNRFDKEFKKADSAFNHTFMDYKCSKCGNDVYNYKGLTQTTPIKLIFECTKCGNIDKSPPVNDIATLKSSSIWSTKRSDGFSVGRSTFETAKVTIESNGKFTINLDGFKVTDTIWITAGKQKVGIPAYKMLEYFKDEPTLPLWNGNGNRSTLEYHMIK